MSQECFDPSLARKRTALGLLLLLPAWCQAFATQLESSPKSIPELQAAIETILKETRTPGAAIVLASRDKVEWAAGLGKSDVAANQPATADTLFRIGSVSKGFVALAALQLQEEGKLKLTDTVKQWVPEVAFRNPWEATNPVRLVHLMEHTSGFDDLHPREYTLNEPTPIALKDALGYGAASRVSRWPPGTRMAYCNSGPAVLAAVVEKVSGKRFEDYVQEHFFQPLHMDSASYFYTSEVERRLTKLYHRDGSTPYPYWHIAFRSAGAINASAKDMANYVRFYLQRGSLDGAQLLQPASLERMERTETLPAAQLGPVAGYGLYNQAILEGPFVFHGHGGAVVGGLTEMAYLPEHGRGYAVMLNSGHGQGLFRITKLLRHYVTRDLTLPALPPVVPVPPRLQQQYAGYYRGISPRNQWLYPFERLIHIQKLDFAADGLSATTCGLYRERWVPVSDRLLRRENQSVATLARLPEAKGEIWIQSGWHTLKKVPALLVWTELVGMALISLLVLSALLFAPIWGWRRLSGKWDRAGPVSVRVLPLLSAVSLVGFDGLFASGLLGMVTATYVDDFTLGVPCFRTVSLMLLSLALPLSVVASFYVLYRERAASMNRVVYWHSVLVAAASGTVAIYYAYWGLIGLRLWAY